MSSKSLMPKKRMLSLIMLDKLDTIANKLLPYATAIYAIAQFWRIYG